MSEWQPIETAPRDGTPILVIVPGYVPAVVEWDGDREQWKMPAENEESEPYEDWPIKYWMPLPPPPTGEEK